jgi:hypothetical protein
MCKENMELYQQFRECPQEAQKPINAGRLKGKTDINPMWRIKRLTEAFGPCGIGWVCPIVEKWIEDSPETAEKIANVRVQLRYKYNGEWSEPIDGIGGAMFVEQESKGLHADDDCFKKAYTDAISVACKSLGIAADIYYARDPDTKYSSGDDPDMNPKAPEAPPTITYEDALSLTLSDGIYAGQTLRDVWKKDATYIKQIAEDANTPEWLKVAINVIAIEIKKANAK